MKPEYAINWIVLHRKLLEWGWYKDSVMVHLFIHLLLKANHTPGEYKGIFIDRGQLLTGRKKLNLETGISEQTLRTALTRLKSTKEVTIKSTSKYSIITVNNYNSYQFFQDEANQHFNQVSNQQLTNNQPTTNQQLTTSKEVKEVKKEKSNSVEIPKIVKDLVSQYMDFKFYPTTSDWAGQPVRDRARRSLKANFDKVKDWKKLIDHAHDEMDRLISRGDMKMPYKVTNFFGKDAYYEKYIADDDEAFKNPFPVGTAAWEQVEKDLARQNEEY